MIPEEPPRRRRVIIDDSGPRGPRRFPLWLLVPVVIILGLALGAALARYIGRSQQTAGVAETVVVTPVPSPSLAPATPAPTAQASPASTPTPRASSRPTATPRATSVPTHEPTEAPTASAPPATAPPATATPRATAAPTPKATLKPTPVPTVAARKTEPIARRQPPAETAAPPPASPAVGVVQAYLENLRRGNFAGATQYLANGDPTETFIESSSRIGHYTSRLDDDGSTHVTADVTTSHGTYFLTFKVENTAAGQRITEHTAIKPGF